MNWNVTVHRRGEEASDPTISVSADSMEVDDHGCLCLKTRNKLVACFRKGHWLRCVVDDGSPE